MLNMFQVLVITVVVANDDNRTAVDDGDENEAKTKRLEVSVMIMMTVMLLVKQENVKDEGNENDDNWR